jgi:diguanylate cyclase (GGDEF)-like protein
VSGLLNREGINHYFHEFTEGGGKVGSLIILDLDHLKVVNDILGHTIGDQLLFDFGELLCNHFGQGAAISRWGGDEFVVFLAEVRKYRIYELLEDLVFIWKEHCCSLGVIDESIGVSCGFSSYPDEGDSFERLFNVADNYLYQAKKGGRGIVVG